MVASIWLQEDLEAIVKQSLERDKSRQIFNQIDHAHDANIAINWEVLSYALDQN